MNLQLNAVAAIVVANLRRLVQDRANYFFIVALPLIIVFALGVAIGGTTEYRVGIANASPSAATEEVTDRIAALDNVTIVRIDDQATLRDDVARRTLDVGWVVERQSEVTTYVWYSPGAGDGLALRTVLTSAVQETGVRDQAVAAEADAAGVDAAAAEQAVTAAETVVPDTTVTVDDLGEETDPAAGIQAELAAETLVVHLPHLAHRRRLPAHHAAARSHPPDASRPGVLSQRSSPEEAAGRFLIAMIQAGIVFFGSMLLFGVDWRAPVGRGAALRGDVARRHRRGDAPGHRR